MQTIKEWVALITALITLITAVIGFWTTYKKLSEQEMMIKEQAEALEDIKNCRGETAISIEAAGNGAHISPNNVNIRGKSTIHERCRYVFLFQHDVSVPGQGWKVADLVQVNTTGEWEGKVKINEIIVGNETEIDARLTSNPKDYVLNTLLPVPGDNGVPSNIVRVRRVR